MISPHAIRSTLNARFALPLAAVALVATGLVAVGAGAAGADVPTCGVLPGQIAGKWFEGADEVFKVWEFETDGTVTSQGLGQPQSGTWSVNLQEVTATFEFEVHHFGARVCPANSVTHPQALLGTINPPGKATAGTTYLVR